MTDNKLAQKVLPSISDTTPNSVESSLSSDSIDEL